MSLLQLGDLALDSFHSQRIRRSIQLREDRGSAFMSSPLHLLIEQPVQHAIASSESFDEIAGRD
jgi:hypothetical protein